MEDVILGAIVLIAFSLPGLLRKNNEDSLGVFFLDCLSFWMCFLFVIGILYLIGSGTRLLFLN